LNYFRYKKRKEEPLPLLKLEAFPEEDTHKVLSVTGTEPTPVRSVII
jgi:hypothetical protein